MPLCSLVRTQMRTSANHCTMYAGWGTTLTAQVDKLSKKLDLDISTAHALLKEFVRPII